MATQPRSSLKLLLVLAGLGALAGIGVYHHAAPAAPRPATATAREASTPPEAARGATPRAPRPGAPDPALAERLAALEAQVTTLQQARPEEPPAPAANHAFTPEEMKELRHAAQQAFDQRVEQHFRAPARGDFPRAAAASIQPRLATLVAQHEGRPVGLDCRSDSCVVAVEFPSYPDAMAHYAALVTADYGINCASSTMLDEPESADRPYRVQVLLDSCDGPASGG
jgi:hypothetical protein